MATPSLGVGLPSDTAPSTAPARPQRRVRRCQRRSWAADRTIPAHPCAGGRSAPSKGASPPRRQPAPCPPLCGSKPQPLHPTALRQPALPDDGHPLACRGCRCQRFHPYCVRFYGSCLWPFAVALRSRQRDLRRRRSDAIMRYNITVSLHVLHQFSPPPTVHMHRARGPQRRLSLPCSGGAPAQHSRRHALRHGAMKPQRGGHCGGVIFGWAKGAGFCVWG